MDINKPITRAEAILSGEDLEPMSRIEYFLKKAANGGGGGGGGTDSSLPPYASNDIGKVLTVGTEDPVMTETVIVPEQTVTFDEGQALLSNGAVSPEDVKLVTSVTATIIENGTTHVLTLHAAEFGATLLYTLDSDTDVCGFEFVDENTNSWMMIFGDANAGSFSGEATVSVECQMPVVPMVSSVIAPTQNVTFDEGQALLSNGAVSPEDVKLVTSVTATIIENGTTHVLTLHAAEFGATLLYTLDSDTDVCGFEFDENTNSWMMIFGDANAGPFSGEATVSVECQKPKPKVKWENRGALYVAFDDGYALNASYNDIMDAVNNGCSVCLNTLFNDGTYCSYLISATSDGDEPKPYTVEFASVNIKNNVPSLTVVRYSASSPTENLVIAIK